MARKYIGQTIDIHAGGEDLMFPHHENEIAQSEAEMSGAYANYWLHNGMLLMGSQKMSKSLGNFFTVRELANAFSYDVLRFFLLSVHYRSPLNFSEELIKSAGAGLERIVNCKTTLTDRLQNPLGTKTLDVSGFRRNFLDALNDDLNTANAIAALFDLVRFANTHMSSACGNSLQAILDDMQFMEDMLGLRFKTLENTDIQADAAEIESLIEQRNAAKAAKDFARADEIRANLANLGVVIKDTREGTKWHYE